MAAVVTALKSVTAVSGSASVEDKTAYIEAMDRYIACQNEEMDGARNNATANYLFLMSTRIESAHQEIDRIATEFNDQVNAFRSARQAGPGLRPAPGR